MKRQRYTVVNLDRLEWPTSMQIPTKRFRLLVVADVSTTSVEILSRFAEAALEEGMVFFCAWGTGCARFEHTVDEVRVWDGLHAKKFEGPLPDDVIMTTSHEGEALEEVLEFFRLWAIPTEGFIPESGYWLVISINRPELAAQAEEFLGNP